jgi:hypothetical protein
LLPLIRRQAQKGAPVSQLPVVLPVYYLVALRSGCLLYRHAK